MSNQSTDELKEIPSILLAEDSEDDAYFFQRALKKTGCPHRFLRVRNGKEAIQTLEKMLGSRGAEGGGPDLIFLDLKMPIMSGFEVLEWLQATRKNFNCLIVVLSGSNDQADRVKAAELGAREYLVKPITPQNLTGYLVAYTSNRECAETEAGEGV